MKDCLFCKIINGEIPSNKIYENKKVIAILDLFPTNKGHTLFIPKNHSENMLKDDEEDLAALMHAVKKIAPKILEAVNAKGFNLIVNTGEVSGQAIMHTHFHVIPRFEGDGIENWHGTEAKKQELTQLKEEITGKL